MELTATGPLRAVGLVVGFRLARFVEIPKYLVRRHESIIIAVHGQKFGNRPAAVLPFVQAKLSVAVAVELNEPGRNSVGKLAGPCFSQGL
jgi:hypothetical protein